MPAVEVADDVSPDRGRYVKRDLLVEVDSGSFAEGPVGIAATVHAPEPESLLDPGIVVFGLPGAGYSRHYFDVEFGGAGAYSQARHHARRGIVFVAMDPLGVGESSQPDPFEITYEAMAEANAGAAARITTMLQEGTVDAGVPPLPRPFTIGLGHSMGGCLTIVQQALHTSYSALVILGYSVVHTSFPDPETGGRLARDLPERGADLRAAPSPVGFTPAELRYAFHFDDVPAALAEPDLEEFMAPTRGGSSTSWGSPTCPPCAFTMGSPGAVSREAALIEVPVFVGAGERDVLPSLHEEAAAFSSCRDMTLLELPRMSHIHNFASTRQTLWRRIDEWSITVSRSPGTR